MANWEKMVINVSPAGEVTMKLDSVQLCSISIKDLKNVDTAKTALMDIIIWYLNELVVPA